MPLQPFNEFSTLKAEVYHSSNVEKRDGKVLSLNPIDFFLEHAGELRIIVFIGEEKV